jgi:hypothetical protein
MSRIARIGKATARGTLRLTLRWIGAAVGALAVLLVGAAVWLSQGPVSVGFLTPYLQEALRDAGFEVEIADAVLAWRGFDDGLDIRLTDARLRGKGTNAAQIQLPALHLRLSGRALFRGELRPASLEIDGARLKLVREPDGRIDIGFGEASGDTSLGDWFKAGDGNSAISELKQIALRGGALEIEDRALGRIWRVPRADLAIMRDAGGVALTLGGALELAGKPVDLALDARWRGGVAGSQVSLRFQGLDPASLADLDPSMAQLAALRVPLSGRIVAGFASGERAELDLALSGGQGSIELPDRFARPVQLRSLELRGRLALGMRDGMPAPERLAIDRFELALGATNGPRAQGNATLTWAPAGLGIETQASIVGLALKEVDQYWPKGFASNAREWVVANIQDGVVPDAKLSLRLPPGAIDNPATPRDAVLFVFQFDNVTAQYIKRMPKIHNGRGQARIDLHEFQLDLVAGRAGKLALSEGKLVIDGLHQRDQTADIQLAVIGPVPAGLELLDSPPLGLASKFGFAPATAGGNAAVRLRFNFPLDTALTLEQVRFSVAANLTELSLKGLFDQYDLTGGALSIAVNPKGLAADGKAAIAGVPVNFKWREEFGVPNAPSRYEANLLLDEQARARFGLAAEPYLIGTVPLSLDASVRRGGAVEAKIDAALDRATLKVDALEWRKAIGVPGRLQAVLRTDGGAIRVDDVTLDAGDFSARGRLEIDRNTGLRLADLPRLRYADADLSVRVERDQRGNASVALNGARVDLQRLNPPPGKRPPPPSPRPIPGPVDLSQPRIAVKIGRLEKLVVSEGMSFGAVSGEFDVHGGRLARLRAQAQLDGGPPMTMAIAPAGNRRTLQVNAGDAAKVARGLDLFNGAEGGALEVRGAFHDDEPGGPLVGRVLIEEFRIVRAPVLARILALGSLTGISDLLSGSGIAFKRLEIPFSALDDAYTIRGARAVGSSLGIAADGTVDRAAGRLDLRGTLVPAYTINSVLGSIPLLGTLLTGLKGEGVFAINFRVSGSPDDPAVSVNPLTSLAPGFLRTIIQVLEKGIDRSGPTPELPAQPRP